MASTPDAYRIDKAKRRATSFDGTGAALEGGRWNGPHVRVVYASQHLATASLEKLVHLPRPIPPVSFIAFAVHFNGASVMEVAPADLPANWRDSPPSLRTQEIGNAWVRDQATAILALPSVIIPREVNYLLNPAHPDFARIRIDPPEEFFFDPRLESGRA